jgi:DNA polymerase III sliding clamp (beta) subunit (PCNA family)
VASGASLTITAVNDVVEVSSNISARVDEDGEITLSQSDLLANATDVDGDNLVATLSNIEHATVTQNADGS